MQVLTKKMDPWKRNESILNMHQLLEGKSGIHVLLANTKAKYNKLRFFQHQSVLLSLPQITRIEVVKQDFSFKQ